MMIGDRKQLLMSASGILCIVHWVPIALLLLLVNVYAEPCARLYIKGLDSTTTFYPQLAGVYKLQKPFLSNLVGVCDADQQYVC